MLFTTKKQSTAFDFSSYALEEIRAAMKQVTGYGPVGGQLHNDNSRKLAEIIREQTLGQAALIYLQTAGASHVRIVTPFNFQNLVSEKFSSYRATTQNVVVESQTFPLVAEFVNYRGKEDVVTQLLPSVKVVPFDPAFAMNVAVVAGMTHYKVEGGRGQVIAVVPPTALYRGAPFVSPALAISFKPNFAGAASLVGPAWAHTLYHKFYDQRVLFMKTVVACVPIDPGVLNAEADMWTKTFLPQAWSAFRPSNNVSRLECLAKMQAYRSKDNAGISAMTYSAYGEDFGMQYRMAEKMGNFRIFLSNLPETFKKFKVRYIARDERELVSAFILMKEFGFTPIHYYGRTLDGVPSEVGAGQYRYSDQIIYQSEVVTKPFTGRLTDALVEEYAQRNRTAAVDMVERYGNAKFLGYRAHVIGLERYVIGMAAPHNAIGVMTPKEAQYTPQELWTTIMVAGYVRNTYLYHRKGLEFMLNKLDQLNVEREKRGEVTSPFMAWQPLRRPAWHPFTKEQRKRLIVVLNDMESFGRVEADISDMDLAKLADLAQTHESFAAKMGKAQSDEQTANAYEAQMATGIVSLGSKSPSMPSYGDDFSNFDAPVDNIAYPPLAIKIMPDIAEYSDEQLTAFAVKKSLEKVDDVQHGSDEAKGPDKT